MRVSNIIKEKLRTDRKFRQDTANALDCSERNIYKLLSNDSDNLTKMAAVKVYQACGFSEEQIFETETVAYQSTSNN